MQHNTETKIWNATLYLRLSRDDGDKEESNSITGQRELLRDFIRTRPELREYAVRIDDGFTGSNFERPSFTGLRPIRRQHRPASANKTGAAAA